MVQRPGDQVRPVYLAGGVTGVVLDSLLDRDGIVRKRIDIAGPIAPTRYLERRVVNLTHRDCLWKCLGKERLTTAK